MARLKSGYLATDTRKNKAAGYKCRWKMKWTWESSTMEDETYEISIWGSSELQYIGLGHVQPEDYAVYN